MHHPDHIKDMVYTQTYLSTEMPNIHAALVILLVLAAATTIATAQDMDAGDHEVYQPVLFDHHLEKTNSDLPRSDEMERKLPELLMDKRMINFFRITKRKGPICKAVKRRMKAQRQINKEDVSQYSRIIKKRKQSEIIKHAKYSRIFKKGFLSRPQNDGMWWRSSEDCITPSQIRRHFY